MKRRIIGLLTACIMALTCFTGFAVTAFAAQNATETIAATTSTENNFDGLSFQEDRVKEFRYLSEEEGGARLKYEGIVFDGTENFVSFTYQTRAEYKVGFALYAGSPESEPIATVKQYGSGWGTDTVMMAPLSAPLTGEQTLWVEALPSESQTDPEEKGAIYPMDFVSFSFSTETVYPAGEPIPAISKVGDSGGEHVINEELGIIKEFKQGKWLSYLADFEGTETSAVLSFRSTSGYTMTYSLYLDDLDNKIATGTYTLTKSWSDWETLSMPLTVEVPEGVHMVYLKLESSTNPEGTSENMSNDLKEFVFKSPVAASSEIPASSYVKATNTAGGSINVESSTGAVKEFDPGDSLEYTDIRFSGKESIFKAVFRTSGTVGVDVYADSVSDANKIASVSGTANNWGSSTYATMSGNLLTSVTGLKKLIIVAQTNDTSTPMDLISFTFEEPRATSETFSAYEADVVSNAEQQTKNDRSYRKFSGAGAWVSFTGVLFDGKEIGANLTFDTNEGDSYNLELRLDAPDGTLIASGAAVGAGWDRWTETLSMELTQPVTGVHTVYLVAGTSTAASYDINVDALTFEMQKEGFEYEAPVYENGEASISITGYSNIGADSIQVVFAVYDGDGRLLDCGLSQKVNTADMPYGYARTFTAELDTTGGDTVKAFIWDSIEVMAPLAAAI